MSGTPRDLLAVCCGLLWLAGCEARQTSRPAAVAPASAPAPAAVTVLATVPEGEPAPPAAPPRVLGLHMPLAGGPPGPVFAARGGGVAFVVERGEQLEVVHGDRAGKRYRAVGEIALSPDGKRCAYGALEGGRWRMVVDGQEGPPFAAVRSPTFSPDGAHLAYQAMAGERWRLVVDGVAKAETSTRYLLHRFTGDGAGLLWLEDAGNTGRGRLLVGGLGPGAPAVLAEGISGFTLDPRGGHAAATVAGGGRRRVLIFDLGERRQIRAGRPYADVGPVTLGAGGGSLAYQAEREGLRYLVLGDREAPLTADEYVVGELALRPDGAGVAAVVASTSSGQVTVRLLSDAGWQVIGSYDQAEGLAFGGAGGSVAFAASRGGRWFVVVDGHEGPPLDRVVTPVFVPDGRVAYRARQDGRRFLVLAGKDGATLRQYPPHDQVFAAQPTLDGKGLEYGARDGAKLTWTVEAL